MVLLTTVQTAGRIGVSIRHVQRLVASGDLAAIGTDRVAAESVAQWLAQRKASRSRGWQEPTAGAAVALLEDRPAAWLGQAQRSRLRSTLADVTGAELAARARNRAQVHRFHAHPRAHARLAGELLSSDANGGVGGLSASRDRVDGYLAASALGRLVQRYRLEDDPAGMVTVRATDTAPHVIAELAAGRRHVLAGLDLAGSTDTRERAAGTRLLDRALAALRG